MTVSTTTAVKSYTGDGSTTAFPTVFVFSTSADIEVIQRTISTGAESTLTLTTDYTVSGGGGTGHPATGTVTAVTAPAATVEWHIRRIVTEAQSTAIPAAGALDSAALELQLDRIVLQVQQHTEQLSRALSFPKTDSSSLTNLLDNSVDRASMFLKFSSTGALGFATAAAITDGFGAGSAAAPSMFFTNDDDTGVYRIGANALGLAIGGYEGVRIVGSGGTDVNSVSLAARATGTGPVISAFSTTDTNVDLNIQPQGTGLVVFGNSNSWTDNGTATITISNVGPAGIGTATISQWFTVKDDNGTTYYIPAWT